MELEQVSTEVTPMLDSRGTVFFRDGKRRIDCVLAYVDDNNEGKQESRKVYEANLKEERLELEYEKSEHLKTSFLKIHAPWEVLGTYAELMKIKVPFKKNDIKKNDIYEISWPFHLPEEIMNPEGNYLTAPFKKDNMEFFLINDKETLFSPSTRNRIVYYILSQCPYDKEDREDNEDHKEKEDHEDKEDREEKKGIKRLLINRTYQSAFPLHDSTGVQSQCGCAPDEMKSRDPNPKWESERVKLYEHWAQFRCFYKEQPLNLIRKYYGEKIGIYFAWLDLYTTMLFFAALTGLIGFIYNAITYDDNIQSKEICDPNIGGSIVMCPLCDKKCGFWRLNSTCTASWQSHLFDNIFTVFFAIFMVIWVTLFLEFWKRRQARLEHEWDLVDFDEESVCKDEDSDCLQEFITKGIKSHLSVTTKCVDHSLSGAAVIFWIALMCACIAGVIAYRLAVYAAFASIMEDSPTSKLPLVGSYITPHLATSFTASCINFIIIMVLSFMYKHLAIWITKKETPKIHPEYENRLTMKMFHFEFVNYYSSCFYIAFFKGKFVGHPGDYKYMFGKLRTEECHPGGCLIELSTQLAVVMVGKQAWGIIQHMLVPGMRNWWSSRKGRNPSNDNSSWEQDHNLQDFNELSLFYKYLDMAIQFGFVTLFVASFPLAPLLALIYNILEVRVHAWKLTTQFRRPVASKARSIGAWLGILNRMAVLSVLTNAFIVSYNSDMIPRLLYQYKSGTMEGYIINSLSVFRISELGPEHQPEDGENPPWFNSSIITTCRYREYRDPSRRKLKLSHTMQFSHLLAAKLGFIVILPHVVSGVKGFVAWMIPEVPPEVMARAKRERYLVHKNEEKKLKNQLKQQPPREDDSEVPPESSTLQHPGEDDTEVPPESSTLQHPGEDDTEVPPESSTLQHPGEDDTEVPPESSMLQQSREDDTQVPPESTTQQQPREDDTQDPQEPITQQQPTVDDTQDPQEPITQQQPTVDDTQDPQEPITQQQPTVDDTLVPPESSTLEQPREDETEVPKEPIGPYFGKTPYRILSPSSSLKTHLVE